MKSRVQGAYQTPNGAGGQVIGELIGTLDEGQFDGSLTYETPECFAERLYGGPVNAQFLRWTGGPTAEDSCKNRPLGFNTLVMTSRMRRCRRRRFRPPRRCRCSARLA